MSRSQYPFQKERLGTMLKIKITICLLLSFIVSFLVTTIVTDYFAWRVGFYTEGLADSAALERGEY
jgi:hypothetical protein